MKQAKRNLCRRPGKCAGGGTCPVVRPRSAPKQLAGAMAIFTIVSLVPSATAQQFQTTAQQFQFDTNPLRSLPPMRALPITSGNPSAGQSPNALKPPAYCDSETLREAATIRAIRFWEDRLGIAVGDHGRILITGDGGQSWSRSPCNVQCRLSDAIWINARRVVIVGGGFDTVTRISRGVVLVSDDAGRSWKDTGNSDLPCLHSIEPIDRRGAEDAANPRQTITAHGESDPVTGAVTFQSHDGGRSWQSLLSPPSDGFTDAPSRRFSASIVKPAVQPAVSADQAKRWCNLTGTHSVIRTSCRLNEQTFLCAGDHGTILRSTDGGQHWQRVHGSEASCAVLIIAGDPDQVPWALAGREALEKRLRTHLLVGDSQAVRGATSAASRKASRHGALEQAAMHLGMDAMDSFPSVENANAIAAIKGWIDVHRPPIVAMHDAMDPDIKSAILQHAVARGAEKVVEFSRRQRGEMLMHDSAVLLGSGALAGDFEDDCQLLVSDFEMPETLAGRNPWIAIHTQYGGGTRLSHGDHLGSGVRLTSKHRLPERESSVSRRRSQVIRGRLRQQAAIADLFDQDERRQPAGQSESFAIALRQLLDQTSRIDQFRSAWSIAGQSIGSGNEVLVWREVSERFSGASAARLAELHAKTREASREWRHFHQSTGLGNAYLASDSGPTGSNRMGDVARLPAFSDQLLPIRNGHATVVSPFQSLDDQTQRSGTGIIQASATLPLDNRESNPAHNLSQNNPRSDVDLAWQMHPVRLIVEDAIARNQASAGGNLENRSIDETDEPPPTAETQPSAEPRINGEAQPTGEAFSADLRRIAERQTAWSSLLQSTSAQVAVGVRTRLPPRLDGDLSEPIWKTSVAQPARTRGASDLSLQFAWDDEFVYIAVQTSHQAAGADQAAETIGTRDADLSGADRVCLGLDLDQDLLTAMRLCFTPDGRTHDDLDGHVRWNPTWYVAARKDGPRVTTEIAIEQASLGVRIDAGDSWFVESEWIAAGKSRRFKMMPDPMTRVRVDFQ